MRFACLWVSGIEYHVSVRNWVNEINGWIRLVERNVGLEAVAKEKVVVKHWETNKAESTYLPGGST